MRTGRGKFVYISGPRMGTSNQKSNGPVLKNKKRKKKRKK
jgi:hypothetical protein